ncbi:MAG: sulfate adenylyltransferase subunit 1 [Clostridium sp.]
MNIVVVGHVDHGKSTLIGRLLYDTNSLPLDAIERVRNISKEKGKAFEYAYLLDAFEEEQKQGITIDTTNIKFRSDLRDYVIIDAPGHKEFLKNMISGASNAEGALLIIDSNEGVQEQSKRHGYILSLLGIKKVFVVINKMDLVSYSEEVYDRISKDFGKFLGELGVEPLGFIPISALNGENLVNKSENLSWYKGGTVLESIDSIEESKGDDNKPFRLPIQDVYKFDHRRIIAGRVESGSLSVGDEVVVYPSLKETVVESIEQWNGRGDKKSIHVKESVGITFRDEFFNKRGEVVVKKGEEKPLVGQVFTSSVFWMGRENLVKGKKYKIKLVTSETECEIIGINKIVDTSSLENLDGREYIRRNEVGEVTIKTKEELTFDLFSNINTTGRFVIVDGYDVSGGGIVTSLVKDERKIGRFVNVRLENEEDLAWARRILGEEGAFEIVVSGRV